MKQYRSWLLIVGLAGLGGTHCAAEQSDGGSSASTTDAVAQYEQALAGAPVSLAQAIANAKVKHPEGRLEVWQTIKDLAATGTTVLLTTQYLNEAEELADRIAILHEGRILVDGTLAELKKLLPPAKVEYVEKQPTLEDVFFALTGPNK